MTIPFVLLTWAISVVFPKVDKIMSILGGLCAVTLDFAIPTFCFVVLSDLPWTALPNISRIIFFGILCAIGYTAVGVTVYLMIKGDDYITPKHAIGNNHYV